MLGRPGRWSRAQAGSRSRDRPATSLPNILTVDVEEWFHILEVEGGHTRDEWPHLESRVEANTDVLLDLFAAAGVRGTFFVVGWVARQHPQVVRKIAAAGHEIASHSYWHEVVARHTPASLAEDLGTSRKLLEDQSGRAGARLPRARRVDHARTRRGRST